MLEEVSIPSKGDCGLTQASNLEAVTTPARALATSQRTLKWDNPHVFWEPGSRPALHAPPPQASSTCEVSSTRFCVKLKHTSMERTIGPRPISLVRQDEVLMKRDRRRYSTDVHNARARDTRLNAPSRCESGRGQPRRMACIRTDSQQDNSV